MMEEFLKELTALSKKYNLEIGGCGCCGSPWIEKVEGSMQGEYVYEIDLEFKHQKEEKNV